MEYAIIYVLISCLSVINVLLFRKIKRIENNMEMDITNKSGIFYNILMNLREFSASDYIKGKPFLLPDNLLEAEKRGYFKKNAIINNSYQFLCIEKLTNNEIEFLCKIGDDVSVLGGSMAIIHIYNDGLWADIKFNSELQNEESANK